MGSKAASVGRSSVHFQLVHSIKHIMPCVERVSLERVERLGIPLVVCAVPCTSAFVSERRHKA